jgi:hypothetical protein
MEENESIMVLDAGVNEEIEELRECCKAGAPVRFKPAE